MRGSSPLARGTLLASNQDGPTRGLIPARAGNTVYASWVPRKFRAHPRSRGEHMLVSVGLSVVRGSSPLARGTQALAGDGGEPGGLIPARAGNTFLVTGLPPVPWAHPRSRGEHAACPSVGRVSPGSSPLARGTRRDIGLPGRFVGLIPARAGNTRKQILNIRSIRAHPRSRGEHLSKAQRTPLT